MLPTAPQLVMGILIAFGLSAYAQAPTAYRWLDKDGGVHYSDLPPPTDLRNDGTKGPDNGVIDNLELPRAKRFPVTLYSSANCGEPCSVGRDLLNRRQIPYSEKTIRTKDDAAALSETMGTAELIVPSITVGQKSAKGYLEAEWNALLDAAGYPRSVH
jgi:hypothetical protein